MGQSRLKARPHGTEKMDSWTAQRLCGITIIVPVPLLCTLQRRIGLWHAGRNRAGAEQKQQPGHCFRRSNQAAHTCCSASPPAVVQGYLGLWRDQLNRAAAAKPLMLPEAIKPLTLAAPISPPAVVQGYLGLWRDQLDRAERAKPLLLQKQVSCLHLLLHCTLPPAL